MESTNSIRYSDEDLEEFKKVIDAKVAKTEAQIKSLEDQINDINESVDEDFGTDMSDDSSVNDSIAMLDRMASRQRTHLRDLKNALLRIKNKTYGVCFNSGQLIDKKRLLAVPTTTKSLAAKEKAASISIKTEKPKPKAYQPKAPKVITKVIKRSGTAANTDKPKAAFEIEDDEDDDDLNLEDDLNLDDDDLEMLKDEEE